MKIQTPLKKENRLLGGAKHVFGKKSLIDIKTVFPFKIFPDRIIVDERKVNIIRMIFFFSYYSLTIPIENIQGVSVESNPFFGSLVISEKWEPGKYLRVRYLKRKDAVNAKSIIQELMIEQQNMQATNIGFRLPQ